MVQKFVKTPRNKRFSTKWMPKMKFSADFTSLIEKKKIDFLPASPKKNLNFFLQKYHYGYLNESSWHAENVFWYLKFIRDRSVPE